MNIYQQSFNNKRASWIVIGLFILFFLFIGLGFDFYYGAGLQLPVFSLIAFTLGVFSSYVSFQHGDKFILSASGAHQLDLADPKQRQWQNVVEEMSVASGIKLPKTYIIDDTDPNAFATGKDPSSSSVVVTRGLLDLLNRDELQGVAAHEMSHIKNYDIRLMLILSVLIGAVALISDWARRGLFRSNRRSSRSSRGQGGAALIILVIWLFTVVLAPILSQLMAMFVSRRREYLADSSGAELTRNPLALASALEKINSRIEPTRSIHEGSAHLCIEDPKGRPLNLKEGILANLLATHPPMNKRIEALKQMAYVA